MSRGWLTAVRTIMSFLTDAAGNQSSARVLTFAWGFAILVMWVIACLHEKKLVDIPIGVGAVMAYVIGGKTVQSFAEPKAPPVIKDDDK